MEIDLEHTKTLTNATKLDYPHDGATSEDTVWNPVPDSMWLVGVECRLDVIRVSLDGKGFFIPGQGPCWHLSHVDTWIREIKITDKEKSDWLTHEHAN